MKKEEEVPEAPARSDCPLDKDELGRSTWGLLHTVSWSFWSQCVFVFLSNFTNFRWPLIILTSRPMSRNRTWKDFSTFYRDFTHVNFAPKTSDRSELRFYVNCLLVLILSISLYPIADSRRRQFKRNHRKLYHSGSVEFTTKSTWNLANLNLTVTKWTRGGETAGSMAHVIDSQITCKIKVEFSIWTTEAFCVFPIFFIIIHGFSSLMELIFLFFHQFGNSWWNLLQKFSL